MTKRIYIKPDTGFVRVGNISDLMEYTMVTESRWTTRIVGGNIVKFEDRLNEDGTGSEDGHISFNAKGFFGDPWDDESSE